MTWGPRGGAAAIALLIACAACASDRDLEVTAWTFHDGNVRRDLQAPAKVDDLVGKRGGGYRLVARVRIPQAWRGEPVTLAIARLPALATLRVNGTDVEPTIDGLLRVYRSPGTHRWRIPARLTTGDTLDLELAVQDTWFQATWLASTPTLSQHPDGSRAYRWISTFNNATGAAAIALVLLIGLSYLLVYLRDRRRVAYGWFAAQALLAGSYPFFSVGVSQLPFGVWDIYSVPLVTLAALASVAYTHAHFGLPSPLRPLRWAAAGTLLVIAASGGPFSARYGSVIVTVVVVLGCAMYQMQLCVRLLLRETRRGDALTLLLSWVCLSILAGIELVYWGGLGMWLEGFNGAGLGISIFAVLQTAAMSREHERVMLQTDALNTELEARVQLLEARDRENRRLAEELRHQVGARSRQLSHALARLGQSAVGPVALDAGTVVDDRYRVVRRLGEGAMAEVYEIEHVSDGRRLALKVLRNTADARMLARFAREAHIASEVRHANVVTIFDIDFASAGFMYVVLELVEGSSLKAHSERYGDVAWALPILDQIVQGLVAIHAVGVVHRDLKPANILLAESAGTVTAKIADFGVSGVMDPDASEPPLRAADFEPTAPPRIDQATITVAAPKVDVEHTLDTAAMAARPRTPRSASSEGNLQSPDLTNAGQLLGTPTYMAPELAAGGGSDPSRDIYSLGVIAYELLCGQRPYGEVPLLCRVNGRPLPTATPLRDRNDAVPVPLADLVERAIDADPARRPNLASFGEAIAQARGQSK